MAGPTTLFQTGNHAARPAAGAGCVLYWCTEHEIMYVSSASSWSNFQDLSAIGSTPTLTGVRLGHTSAQSVANNSNVKAVFGAGTEVWDEGGFHDTATNNTRVTIPSGGDGKYVLIATGLFAINSTGVRRLRFLKNNTGVSPEVLSTIPAHATLDAGLSLAVELSLVATDYVELEIFQNSGGALNVSATFSVRKIG